ncbi:MAG TPA: chromosomal replication initiator protein DnaA [Dehalococcoidia bacterium]|nr:chromosomal replication initiator protein DnaA [Dehalococcoidia bacterium]
MALAAGLSAPEIWDQALGQLLLRVTRQNFDSWLRNTTGLRYEGRTLIIGTPTELARDFLATRMRSVIHQALTAVAGPGLRFDFEVRGEDARCLTTPLQATMLPSPLAPLNPRFTFATFLPGSHNRLALVAALDVTDNSESPYSPLFITGGPGSGKTHLLHAVAERAAKQGLRVVLVTAEQFLSDFTGAVRNRTGAAFRSRYRDLDILLVDDVQALTGKRATQNEFLQTVTELRDLGRRVVVAGDLQVASNGNARFISGFQWGLIAEIAEPSMDDRIRFLFAKTACQRVSIPDEVLHYVALRIRSNLRDLEGALNRLVAVAHISDEPITIDFAARALKPLTEPVSPSSPREVQPAKVLQAVCDHLGISLEDLAGRKRTRSITYARHLAMYLLRQDAGLTFQTIAEALGRGDHSTVVHACKQIEAQIKLTPALQADLDAVRTTLGLLTA